MSDKVSNMVYVLSYISNFAGAEFWSGKKGADFSELLRKNGVGNAVFVAPGADTGASDLSNVNFQTANIGQVDDIAKQTLLSHKAVFFISDSKDAVSLLAKREGCLPFLLSEKGTPGFATEDHIEINSLSSLECYFDGQPPYHLVLMLRKHPEEYKAEIRKRNARFTEQAKVRGGLYIHGTGTNGKLVYGECIKAGVKVLGFVDNDPSKQGTVFCGLPVVGPSSVDPSREVVVLASGNYSYDILKQLKDMGFEYVQNLAEFFFEYNCFSQMGIFFHDDLWQSRVKYHALYLKLADSASQYVLENIVGFRMGFDLSMPGRICDRGNPQWFDGKFFKPIPEHVFVDGGAFDGDTALSFIRLNGDGYKAVHLFEPDPEIAQRATDNLKKYERVYVHNMGLSNKSGTLSFERTGLTDGRLSGNGIPVKIDTVDSVVEDKITFLKMDVEGSEEDALSGAERHIRDGSPLLAIAVYHKAEDIWAVPRQILNMNSGYNLYLRHYTQFAYETVLYATRQGGL